MPTDDFPSELFLPFRADNSKQPRYLVLFRAFQQAIIQGKLINGAKLPASRVLAKNLGLSRNTVKTAYEMLLAEGYIETRHGSGSFVSSQLPEHIPQHQQQAVKKPPYKSPVLAARARQLVGWCEPNPVLSGRLLAIAQPDQEHYPWPQWHRSIVAASRQLQQSYKRANTAMGHPELRTHIAHYLQVMRGVNCDAAQVMICSGSQQAMYLAFQMLLNPGDPVLVEDPGYSGIDGALVLSAAQRIPVAADQYGFRLHDGLAAAPEARVVVLTPSRNFPMGYTLSLERRLELIEWAGQNGGWIIEDDYDSEFHFDGSPLTALQGLGGESSVIYTGTFSRVLHHSLRLGYLVLPENLAEPFARAKRYLDGGLPQLPQLALANFMTSGHFAGHIRRMRKLYQQRRTTLQTLISHYLPELRQATGSDGSMHSVFLLPDGYDDQQICDRANERGLGIRALSRYYSGVVKQQGLVIGFAGGNQAEMEQGIILLAGILHKKL